MISLWPTRMPYKRPSQSRIDEFRAGAERMREIVREVALEHGVSVSEVLGDDRHRSLSRARHDAMARIYSLRQGRMDSPFSLPAIGRFFGRDHSTCLAGIRAHERRMALNGVSA